MERHKHHGNEPCQQQRNGAPLAEAEHQSLPQQSGNHAAGSPGHAGSPQGCHQPGALAQSGIAQDHMEQGAEENHNAPKSQSAGKPGLMIPEHQPPCRKQKRKGQKIEAVAKQSLGQLPEQVQHSRTDPYHGKQQEQRQKGQHQPGSDPPKEGGFWLLRQYLRRFFVGFCPRPLGCGFGSRLRGGSFCHEDASRRRE